MSGLGAAIWLCGCAAVGTILGLWAVHRAKGKDRWYQ